MVGDAEPQMATRRRFAGHSIGDSDGRSEHSFATVCFSHRVAVIAFHLCTLRFANSSIATYRASLAPQSGVAVVAVNGS
jgi:hypothetical protein